MRPLCEGIHCIKRGEGRVARKIIERIAKIRLTSGKQCDSCGVLRMDFTPLVPASQLFLAAVGFLP